MSKEIRIFTIGFTQKSAREFFNMLIDAGVKAIIDVRLKNTGQMAGFSKKEDLEYFLKTIGQMGYLHKPEWAPTEEILDAYKKKEIDWIEYKKEYHTLLVDRQAENLIKPEEIDGCCLLCSEPTADKCHRRLLAEYLKEKWKDNIVIQHL